MRYEDENIWLTQKMMSTLYGVDVRTINEHIKKIYSDSELEEDSTIRNFRIVQTKVHVRWLVIQSIIIFKWLLRLDSRLAMIYSDDFGVSEFSHKKYLRFSIDWFSRSYRCGTALLLDKHTKSGGKRHWGEIELELSECLESCKIEFPFWQKITTVIMMR